MFKYAISNIAWDTSNDEAVYNMMKKYSFTGLEIAPTRIFPEEPYSKIGQAIIWKEKLYDKYQFEIPSMQSIWYGRKEKLFGTESERKVLFEYTKLAIEFARAIGCHNLVFGCPQQRQLSEGADEDIAISFFSELGEYALSKKTVIGLEANPTIYNTNYINDTKSAIELIRRVDSDGFKLNLDVGTMIQNEENIKLFNNNIHLINHIHISEPKLIPIMERKIHSELRNILNDSGYKGFVSIEMGKTDNLKIIEEKMKYLREVFR